MEQLSGNRSSFFNSIISITEKEILASVGKDRPKLLKILLRAREEKNPVISVDRRTGAEHTVLHRAAYLGRLGILKWYKDGLKFKNINPEDNLGSTPLSCAIGQNKTDVVEYFIDLGYGINATSKDRNFTP